MTKYYITEWALRRQAEIIELPEDFEIHSDYLKVLDKDKIVAIVHDIRQMFFSIYQDISDHPERFKMPMVEIRANELNQYGYPPAKAMSAKKAPFMFFDALINVLISGDIVSGEIAINPEKLNYANKNYKMKPYGGYAPKSYAIKNIDKLYSQFGSYGLFLTGLKKFKLSNDIKQITLSYPDNPDLLLVLKWMADKAHEHEMRQDFMMCQYRLLQDDMKSLNYGTGADFIADRTHTQQEQDFVYKMDAALRRIGLISHVDNRAEVGGDDSYSIYYYEKETDFGKRWDKSYFRIRSKQAKLYMCIRLENIQNCVEHIMGCSDKMKSFFIPGDKGCGGHSDKGKCNYGHGGQRYVIDGVEYWKCGSICKGPIQFQPRSEDIADYIRLVELGNK